MTTREQIVDTAKANFEAITAFRTTAFGAVEKLAELNVQAFKTSLSEASEAATAASSIRTMDQFVALRNSIVQPMGGKVASYAQHVFNILSQTSAEMTKVFEGSFAESKRKVAAAVEMAVQNAPIGGSVAESTMATAKMVNENITSAAKQASDVAEANILKLTTEATKASHAAKVAAAA